MVNKIQANCLPVLIGSLPLGDHEEAFRLVLKYTPEIPLWVQLPIYPEEGMIQQFQPGLPGLVKRDGKTFIDTLDDAFDKNLLEFYEEYMAVVEGRMDIDDSRFVMKPDTARGFFVFMENIEKFSKTPVALKGQITGPITFCTAVKDQKGRAIFYDQQIRDVAVKLLALKARWQIRQLSKFDCPGIVFFDEPALAGIGSSEFISISNEEVAECFKEVIAAVHAEGGIAGIHVCANADWPIILESSADILSFDAYSYFDKFILYGNEIKNFIESGRIIAWGIVPTMDIEDIERETAYSLTALWDERIEALKKIGMDFNCIFGQSLITPSCGTGSLNLDRATRVLRLTKKVSDTIRERINFSYER